MKKRREHDFKRAKIVEHSQNNLYQIVLGMFDIKLANAEMLKRWDWELSELEELQKLIVSNHLKINEVD